MKRLSITALIGLITLSASAAPYKEHDQNAPLSPTSESKSKSEEDLSILGFGFADDLELAPTKASEFDDLVAFPKESVPAVEDLDEPGADVLSRAERDREALRKLFDGLLAVLQIFGGLTVENVGMNGIYDGTLQADNGSTAPAIIQLDHYGGDVSGTLWITDDTLSLDPGFFCKTVDVDASQFLFDASTPDGVVSAGQLQRNVSVLGMSYTVDVDHRIERFSDYEAYATLHIRTPFPCEDLTVTGTFYRRADSWL